MRRNIAGMIRILLFALGVSMAVAGYSQDYRSLDGSGNNQSNPEWGAVGAQLPRVTSSAFADGISAPAGPDRPNPRVISNVLFDQQESILDVLNSSDFVWAFGQFVDHDITLVENDPFEPAFVSVPADDAIFTPGSSIFMFRSAAMPGTGTSIENPRQHFNAISAFVDGSAVYGSDIDRANWLRTFSGGKLKVSEGNLLPWDTQTGEFNAPKDEHAPFMADDVKFGAQKLFVAGDVRANENPLLLAFHTLFVREHNRVCEKLAQKHPEWNDEMLYQEGRRWVSAYIQRIVFDEWLPAMGVKLPAYTGYQPNANPGIMNVFSAAAFRLGHTLINSNVIRMDNEGGEITQGHIRLRDAFFNPTVVTLAGGIEPYIKGMATQVQQEMDCKVVNDVRNFLFGSPNQGGLDLATININRGRERGLPDYNTIREDMGLAPVSSFIEITNDAETAAIMESLYGDINAVDPWVGMLSEYHMPNAIFGELIMTIIERQFQALRDGDRFFYRNDGTFTAEEIEQISSTTLRDIIMRNTDILLMQDNVFTAMPHEDIPNGPDLDAVQLEAVAYPNPTNGRVSIKVYMEEERHVSVRIYDMNGRLISDEAVSLYPGDNFLEYDLEATKQRGMYNILIDAGYEYALLRVIRE